MFMLLGERMPEPSISVVVFRGRKRSLLHGGNKYLFPPRGSRQAVPKVSFQEPQPPERNGNLKCRGPDGIGLKYQTQ